jgi:hypothetical protein
MHRPFFMPPLQGFLLFALRQAQGVALGLHIAPLRGLIIIVLIALLAPATAYAGAAEPKLRALYGFSKKYFKGKSDDDIAKWLLENKFDAIFGGYKDKKLRETLRRYGISVYAEAAIFYSSTEWKKHPETRPINQAGKPIEKVQWYRGLCPNQDRVIEQRLGFIKQLVKKYKVDGVWLDFMRYPCHWEVLEPRLERTCFCPVCLKKFAKDTGIKHPKDDPAAFAEWKTDQIAGFVEKAAAVAKKENPDVTVGIFAVPWKKGERDNAIINIIAQDYEKLAPHVDIFSPMVYHKMVGEKPEWISEMVRYTSRLTGKPVVPVIQAVSEPGKLGDDEFIQAIRQALKFPSKGVIILSMKHFLGEGRTRPWLKAAQGN